MPENQSWYEVVEGAQLQQGDLLRAFLVAQPPANIELGPDNKPLPPVVDIDIRDVVVLTQSCNLVNSKIHQLLVCPHLPLSQFVAQAPEDVRQSPKSLANLQEQIRQGNQPPLHMLAASQELGLGDEIRVVDFRLLSVASISFAQRTAEQAGRRLRLKSPCVEYLSQAFARFFMRVGLPSDIPRFSSRSR